MCSEPYLKLLRRSEQYGTGEIGVPLRGGRQHIVCAHYEKQTDRGRPLAEASMYDHVTRYGVRAAP